jgi:hypothetical protein
MLRNFQLSMIRTRPELATPALNDLLDFWLARCDGEKLPASARISPVDLRPWTRNIVVFEVVGEKDFVYTYYGEALAEAYGHSRLGATLDALPDEQRAILLREYAEVQRAGQPVSRTHTADFGSGERTWERLVLPLSSDGETVDKLIVAAYELPSTAANPGVPA